MTKGESEILNHLKLNLHVSEDDILNTFKDPACNSLSVIRAEDRLKSLVELGYVRGSNYYEITPKGLHALDEYLENVTRLDRVEAVAKESNDIARGSAKSSSRANVISIVAAVISLLAVIATVVEILQG